jgi:cell division protein FtsI/penicillin-binding protein 2
MAAWSKWLALGASLGIIAALVPVVKGSVKVDAPLRRQAERAPKPDPGPDLTGLDLLRLKLRPRRVTTPLSDGRTAELTLDPVIQRAATSIMKRYKVPEAGLVMLKVDSGEVLAYASHVKEGKRFDVNVVAEAPAASTFKIVTAAALVEKAGLNENTEQCYRGGRSKISADELREDPKRDKWCATLAMAMGRSLNVVFGRLAQKHLTPEDLTEMGGAFGYGAPVPFASKNQASAIEIPGDPLEFARSAAGFWHTSLSPLEGAVVAQTIANQGVAFKPRLLRRIYRGEETLWSADDKPSVLRRSIKPSTAKSLTTMMVETVRNGSAYKTFHDRRGRSFLPGIEIAAKTGTLTRHKENRHYTWLVAFAPADKPEIAVAALVVNTPLWHIKGPDLARDVMRAYFAKQAAPGVSPP